MAHMIKQIIVICMMIIISTNSSPLRDSRSIDDRLIPTNMEGKMPIKKVYTYLSEWKRLPVFNFGIGKRWPGVNGNKAAQRYSFGFGKRSTDNESSNRLTPPDDKRPTEKNLNFDVDLVMETAPYNENLEDSQAVRRFINKSAEHRFMFGSNNRRVDDQGDIQEYE